jgi:hypothetical protein
VQIAADIAALLQLELIGLFLDDGTLRRLADFPFAREFRPLGGGWQRIDMEQLQQDLELAARRAERMFATAAKQLSTRCHFEVLQAPTVESVAAFPQAEDIVMIAEPASAMERAVQQFAWVTEAAFRSAAAVMLVPAGTKWAGGPVVAIATSPSDPSVDAAAAIAALAQAELLVVEASEASETPSSLDIAAEVKTRVRKIAIGHVSPTHLITYSDVLPNLQERMVVISRGPLSQELAANIVSTRHVPVLIVEPSEETARAGQSSDGAET